MVLSNKKLKQRIRSLLAESVAAAESRDATGAEDAKQQLQGLKELLSSKTHRGDQPTRRGGKRRKKKTSAEDLEPAGVGPENREEAGDIGGSVDSNNNNNNTNKKRKKKRKREEEGGSERAAESSDQTQQKGKREEEDGKKKKKEKKKKRKKEKQGECNEKLAKNVNGAGRSNDDKNEMKATEAAAINTSEENNDAMKKVYVGGIPYYSTEDDIRSFFEGCGTITEVDCMVFPESGKFRGIAILSFKTEAAAKRALALDGADMGGLYLKVQPYKATRNQKADFSPEVIDDYHRIYAGNLSWDVTEDDLRKLFSDCRISSIRFGEDKETGDFKGYAHVDFEDGQSHAVALKLDQTVVCGRPVRIRSAVPRKGAGTKQPASKSDGGGGGGGGARSGGAKRKSNVDGNASSGGAKKKKRQTCYVCGVPGHLSSSCPQKKADGSAGGSS